MAIEKGIVVDMGAAGGRTAWVETVASSACESCSSRESCHAGPGKSTRKVEAINEVGAKIGDHIQLSMDSASLLKASFLLYLFPILCMLAGGLTAQAIFSRFFQDPSYIAAGTAFLFLGVALLVVRIKGNRLGAQAAYQPKIIRILGHNPFPDKILDGTMVCDQGNSHQK